MKNPLGSEDKISPQDVPQMLTLSFRDAPSGQCKHPQESLWGTVVLPFPSNYPQSLLISYAGHSIQSGSVSVWFSRIKINSGTSLVAN